MPRRSILLALVLIPVVAVQPLTASAAHSRTRGTVLVKDILPGRRGSKPNGLTIVADTLFFYARGELWKSDGTRAGTVLVKDIGPDGFSPTGTITAVGDELFFLGSDKAHGPELWKSDGTAKGTVLVRDIWRGRSGSSPRSLADVGGTLFFFSYVPPDGNELWKSDGTRAGTVLVKSWPGRYGLIPDTFITD